MTRNINVQYAKAEVRKGDLKKPSFEHALRASLQTVKSGSPVSKDASLRRFDGAPDYGSLIMNHAHLFETGIFIEMVRFAPGSRIPLIQTGAGGSEYALRNADTPQGSELIRGFLYALAIGDHFLYVSREVAMIRNEMFLEWLLGSQTAVSTHDLRLSFEPSVNIVELPSVGRMVLRPKEPADSRNWAADVVEPAQPTEVRAGSERLAGESVFKILKAAQFTDERIASLEARGVDIELKIEIFFKSDGTSHELSRDDVSDLIKNVPEDELTLYSEAGREKAGRIRRMAFPAEVETVGEFFDRNSISGALWAAHRHFTKNGYV